jgi:transposase-like protein
VGRKPEEQSKFDKFVRGFGVEELARHLDINPSAVYHWLRGKNVPDWKNAVKVQKLAKSRGVALSLDKLYQHYYEVRRETSSLKPQHARA